MTLTPTTTANIPGQRSSLPDLKAAHLPTERFRSKGLPSWTSLTADDDTLAVVVLPETNWQLAEAALAYGLFHAGDRRRLALVLPSGSDTSPDPAQATRIRAPFLKRHIEVFTYVGDRVIPPQPMDDKAALAAMSDPGTVNDLADLTPTDVARVSDLIVWANKVSGLTPVHLKHYVAWQCAGRRLLKIHGGKRRTLVTAGVDYRKPDLAAGQEPPLHFALSEASFRTTRVRRPRTSARKAAPDLGRTTSACHRHLRATTCSTVRALSCSPSSRSLGMPALTAVRATT